MKKGILGILFVFLSIQNIFAEYTVLDWTEDPNSVPAALYQTLFRYALQQEDQQEIIIDEGIEDLIDREGKIEKKSIPGKVVVIVDATKDSSIICESRVFHAGTILGEKITLSNGTVLSKGTTLLKTIIAYRAIFDFEKNVFQWSGESGSIGGILFEAFKSILSEEEISRQGEYIWINVGSRKGGLLSIQSREIPLDGERLENQFKLSIYIRRGIQEVMSILNERVEDLKTGNWDSRKIPTELETQMVSRMFATVYIDTLKYRGLLSISTRELKTLFAEIAQSQDWSENLTREVLSEDFFQEMREFLGPGRFDVLKFANLIARRLREVILFRKG